MSQKAASDFIGQLAVNATLRQELTTALADAADRSQSLSRMVEFASLHGYEVTPEELAEFAVATGDTNELTGEQLLQVAGGAGIISFGQRRPPDRPIPVNCGSTDCACVNCR